MMEEYLYRSRIRERGEHLRSGLPNVPEALGQKLGISIPQLDVVAGRGAGFEPDRVANHESGGLCFRLADSARGAAAAFSAMQELMRLC
jgi:hypothetical protein